MANFVRVASTSDLPPGETILVEVEGEPILLANVGGEFYAVTETCTHAECPLSEGSLEGNVLECPCHGSQFNVTTGEVIAAPAEEPLTKYPVRVEGDDVLIGPADSG
ncbi:MAG: non-heme iron oxygenase ferredoxin subunit [Chloroflexi bacterium]|nr:non-heme iron oxygenase ferredoxin subunit [Chloroflexota bacterium]